MSTSAVDEPQPPQENNQQPPQENNQQPPASPPMLPSLPEELVLEIVARSLPHKYPILSRVSKTFGNLVRSPEIYKIRSLLGRDSLYICFLDITKSQTPQECFKWITLRRIENNNTTENRVAAVDLGFPYGYENSPSVIAVGPEIFFICGSLNPSRSLFIFDSRSGKLRSGPCMNVDRQYKTVGLVGGKIFVIGGFRDDDIKAEAFDLKNQIWERAPITEAGDRFVWMARRSVLLDGKVCVLRSAGQAVIVYDPRDGSCRESFSMPQDRWWETSFCVIQNVLYVYYARLRLRWYDSNLKLWRVVKGLPNFYPPKVGSLAMAEYCGKLAVLWDQDPEDDSVATKIIWCRMIQLNRREDGIHGTAESDQILGTVPRSFTFHHCLSVSV